MADARTVIVPAVSEAATVRTPAEVILVPEALLPMTDQVTPVLVPTAEAVKVALVPFCTAASIGVSVTGPAQLPVSFR